MGRVTLTFLLYLIIIFVGTCINSFSLTTTEIINNQLKISPNLGIYIKNLTKGKVISSHNSNKKFIPASNQKIITTLSSLNYLSSNYRFNSYFFVNNIGIDTFKPNKLIEEGSAINFYIDTRGDPTLSSGDIVRIVRFFKKKNLRSIKGNIILDNTYFEEPYFNNNWKKSWKGLVWAPHVSSVAVDENLYKAKGNKDLLMTDNPLYLLGIKLLREFRKQGIQVKGKVVLSRIPVKTKMRFNKVIYKHSSKDLGRIVKVVNKKSNNLYAEHLFKKLSANFYRSEGSWKSSAAFVSSFLVKKVGLNSGSFYISDGSGLSRKNKITPKSMVLLLDFARETEYFPYFYASLPLAGVDGTLLKRFKSKPLYKNLRAKTGYINKVSSLSGYFTSKNGDLYAFSIIVNNYNYSVRPFIDRLLTKIYYL
ncbi:D-alanyl-D-alanine carboxypeptidase/D-alanyl-D-alanine-endopeptidase [bacterium]|jgi:D-alanyl-D-alanine carboxypeptidase/D-alanyl-D-alanine-endopeptidase (penicillin-binding protein 4)|nr:D-alanyl-D-alanine carboxypeptidase/D-alanyl-D-alanine-endopeptidase [bacterium]MBT3795846.1 D-alanyl-D-alanine carboxypeptidase/D-alanyl-D-alanine-endopeptidase [bacterium]MBT4634356.1 D-alanyl-D-alanine carboxypeptidase/D-alanyl-D-alanine-endopeptidase [bacterium]